MMCNWSQVLTYAFHPVQFLGYRDYRRAFVSHLSIEEAIEEGPETAFGIFKMIA
jgi:hypothetical protein